MTDASDAGEAGSNEVEPEPRAKLGEEVAAQMDAIEADFGDDYKIGNIVTVVEVIRPEGASLRVRCNQQPWIGSECCGLPSGAWKVRVRAATDALLVADRVPRRGRLASCAPRPPAVHRCAGANSLPTRSIGASVSYAPTVAESRSRIAAATRSAIRAPVKPISSCSNAGLPCVT